MRAILQLVRAPAVFTAISNILAAHLIAGGGRLYWRELILLCGASVLIYSAGMVLNDCFDFTEDARERPSRPLPSGRVRLGVAWASAWILLTAGFALAGIAGRRSLIIAGLLILAVVLYDGFLKAGPAGSLVMGACRYLNWLLGFSFLPLSTRDLLVPIPVLIYIAALTLLASEETRAHSRTALRVCIAGMILAACSVVVLLATGALSNLWASIPLVLGLVWVLRELSLAGRDFRSVRVQSTITFLLLGIIPLDALLVFAGGPWWGALVVLTLLLPSRIAARAIYVT